MLETLDLSLQLEKKPYKEAMAPLARELPLLQRVAFEHQVPIMVVFEGWDASGKGDSIAQLVDNLDPRGFKVHVTRDPLEAERERPFYWRFWQRTPPRGTISIFDRAWHGALLEERMQGTIPAHLYERLLAEGNEFERQLTDSGTLILKLWLHISQAEQKRRLERLSETPEMSWRISDRDFKRYREYRRRAFLLEEILSRTHNHWAPWTLIEAENVRFRRVKVVKSVVEGIRNALISRGITPPTPPADSDLPKKPTTRALRAFAKKDPLKKAPVIPMDSLLARVDLSLNLTRDKYEEQLEVAQEKLRKLHFSLLHRRRSVIIAMEGWDAAGKGGCIKRLTENLDPRGYRVVPISAPKGDEATHHYLWRFWREMPRDGQLVIFDRTWYGRVLVERIEGFCTVPEWQRAYQEINEFERSLSEHGAILCKFWLHISPQEQLQRFLSREMTPAKQHKIVDEDWRNRAKWPQYVQAVTDMLRQTSTARAPWTIIEANDKLWARMKTLKTVIASIEEALEGTNGR